MIPYDLNTLCEQNKLRTTEEETAFISDFFARRKTETNSLHTVNPQDLPTDTRFLADKSSLRDDTVSAYPDPPTIVNQAPDTEGDYFKTPKVKA